MNNYLPEMLEALAAQINAVKEFQEAKQAFDRALAKLTVAARDAEYKTQRYLKQGEP